MHMHASARRSCIYVFSARRSVCTYMPAPGALLCTCIYKFPAPVALHAHACQRQSLCICTFSLLRCALLRRTCIYVYMCSAPGALYAHACQRQALCSAHAYISFQRQSLFMHMHASASRSVYAHSLSASRSTCTCMPAPVALYMHDMT